MKTPQEFAKDFAKIHTLVASEVKFLGQAIKERDEAIRAEAREEAQRIANLVLSFGDKKEATETPYWGICEWEMFDGGDGPSKTGRVILIQGIWFSRDAAEKHRKARIYEYGEQSFVFCFSAHHSWDLRNLHEQAKAIREVQQG